MSITSRHRFEFATVLAIAFLAGVVIAHTTGRLRETSDAFFDLWLAGWGAAMIIYPQWFYQPGTVEQVTRKQKRIKICGFVMLPVATIIFCLRLFWG